jgi:hypothetical protein
VEAFAAGIAQALATAFDASVIRTHAEQFGRTRFGDEIEALARGTVEVDAR